MIFDYIKRAAYPVALFIMLIAMLVLADDQNWVNFTTWMASR